MTDPTPEAEQMRDDIRAFLTGLDRGYFGGDVILALENSAFIEALRRHVAGREERAG